MYKFLHHMSIMAMPNILLFNIYNQNHAHLILSHVVILAVILAIISSLGRGLIKILSRSDEGCFLCLLLFWIAFWFFERFREILPIHTTIQLLAIITLIILCFVLLFRFISNVLKKFSLFFGGIAGITILLFVFSAFPALVSALSLSETSSLDIHVPDIESENSWQIRRHFRIDEELPNPDIFWFHMDGMIGFQEAEYYFGLELDDYLEKLLDMGFEVGNAEFIAAGTAFGVSALLSPDFYDSVLQVEEGIILGRSERHALFTEMIARYNISLADEVAPYHELFHAFLQNGYTATTISLHIPHILTPIDQFYRLVGQTDQTDDFPFAIVDQAYERHFLVDALDLIELMVMLTPVPGRLFNQVSGESRIEWQSIPTYFDEINRLTSTTLDTHHERQLFRALLDHLENSPSSPPALPLLTYITLMFAHPLSWTLQVGEEVDLTRIDLYPLAYEYSLNVMFNMIDMILERNSDAVIVIQADHGIHDPQAQTALLEAGFSEEEVLRLHNSVMSAVRIPELYGGLDAPLDPLNISRELVNRFVGENYELLDN